MIRSSRAGACSLLICLGVAHAEAAATPAPAPATPFAAPAPSTAASAPGHHRHVQGEFSYETGPAGAWVKVPEVATQWPADGDDGKGRGWRMWLMDSQFDYRAGKRERYYDAAYEPLTTELVSEAAKHSIEFNPLYQQLVIHRAELRRDGRWLDRLDPARISLARREGSFEQDMADGRVTALLLLADVRAGDVVRIAYTIRGSNPILAGNEEDTVHVGWTSTVLDRHVRALFDPGVRIASRRFNTEAPVRVRTVGDHQELTVDARLVPGRRDEGDYPNWFARFPMVQFSPDRSWADVVKWALPLYPEPGPLPADLAARLPAWQAIADPHARAFEVLRVVQREIRYFGTEMGDNTHRPAAPSETWERRYGDCKDKAYLLTTLLRGLGVQAEPALVSIAEGKGVFERLPSAGNFDHVIVRATIDGKAYWLDPTLSEQHGDLRTLDVHPYGAALPVRSGQDALVAVEGPARTDNSVLVLERYAPSADGKSLDLRIETTYTGMRAQFMRRRVNQEGREELSRSYADFYRKRFDMLEVATPMGVSDPADADRLVLTEHYLVQEPWVSHLGRVRQLEVYADALNPDTRLPATVDRQGPLALARPATLRQRIELVLPKGWSVLEPPPSLDIASRQISYRRSTQSSGEKVEISHELKVLADHVPPADLNVYLRSLRQVDDAIGSRLSLQGPAGDGDAERRERLRNLLRDAMDSKPKASP